MDSPKWGHLEVPLAQGKQVTVLSFVSMFASIYVVYHFPEML